MEPSILKFLADNPKLFDATKNAITSRFTIDMKGYEDVSNEHIGEVVRARLDGRRLVEEAFIEIAKYKTPNEPPVEINPAR